MKRIVSFLSAFCFSIFCCVGILFAFEKNYADAAAFSPEKISIINTDGTLGDGVLSGATISSTQSLPVDNTTGLRKTGSCITQDAGVATISAGFNSVTNPQVDFTTNLSIFMWVFIPTNTFSSSNFQVQLEGSKEETNCKLVWNADNLFLSSVEKMSLSSIVYVGWNLIELPIMAVNEAYYGDSIDTTAISNYFSFSDLDTLNVINNDMSFRISLFDVYISETTQTSSGEVFVHEDQGYIYVSTSEYFNNQWSGYIYNDKIILPTFSSSENKTFNFAWIGENQYVTETGSISASDADKLDISGVIDPISNDVSYSWKIAVRSPDGSSQIKEFGSELSTRFTTGTYRFQVVLVASSPLSQTYAYGPIYSISIGNENSGLWIDQARTVVNEGLKYKIFFNLDTTNWVFNKEYFEVKSSSSSILKIVEVNFEHKYIIVEGLKEGKSTISISAIGNRTKPRTGQSNLEFEDSIKISVNSKNESNSNIKKIVLWCVLGVTITGIGAFGITYFVKNRKIEVK